MANGSKPKREKPKGSLKPTLNQLYAAIDEALQGITQAVYAAVDRGLDKAARHMEHALEVATPHDTYKTQQSWKIEFKYRGVRYINNTSTRPKTPGDKITSGEGEIPIVNLLEFGRKGKPFVRRTIQENQNQVVNIIKGEIEHGKA